MAALPFRVLLITDEGACAKAGRGVVETVTLALSGGPSDVAVLLRAKRAPPERVLQLALELKRVTDDAGALLLVHTHVDVALAVGAFGVHVADGVPTPDAGGLLLGASRHRGASLAGDEVAGLDYVMLAPVFGANSKPDDTRAPLGLETFARACADSSLPVVALGGVDGTNARACMDAGASGVAVVAAVMSAADPRAALLTLRDVVGGEPDLGPRGSPEAQ